MKRAGAIILARLDSSRLPGKALLDVRGKPMLVYVLERAEKIRGVDRVVLATSDRPVDDPLETFANKRGVAIFRGSAEDVAGRALGCARKFGFYAFVRINGDSPLIDFKAIAEALEMFKSEKLDFVTNVFKRTFPVGMSVEVFSTDAFARGYEKMTAPEHFEHVTRYFYDNPARFAFHNMESGDETLADVHLAVDTKEDLKRLEWMLEAMDSGHLAYSGLEVVELYRCFERKLLDGSEVK